MYSIIKNNSRPIFWNAPLQGFFRNDLMDMWNRYLTDTVPSLNISEEKDKYKVEVAAPGLKKEDLIIDVHGNVVTISSEKEEITNDKENDRYSHKEYNYSHFSRSFTVPESADASGVKAKYCDGVLCLDIPKRKQKDDKVSKKVSVE